MDKKEISCCVTACERPLDQAYWNAQWESNKTGWDIGYPAPSIVQYMDLWSDKNSAILIPGCGNAYEAEYLLENGFQDITLMDIAPEAVSRLQQKFKNHPQVKVVLGDFFEHEGLYDLIIEQTFLSALPPYLRPKYAWKMHHLLKDSGRVIGLLFNRHFDVSPPFGGSVAEYETLFHGSFTWDTFDTAPDSIPERKDMEVFINLTKRSDVLVKLYAFRGITCNGCMATVEGKIQELPEVIQVQMASDYSYLLLSSTTPIALSQLQEIVSYDEKYTIEQYT